MKCSLLELLGDSLMTCELCLTSHVLLKSGLQVRKAVRYRRVEQIKLAFSCLEFGYFDAMSD